MIKTVIHGVNGKMGKIVAQLAQNQKGFEVIGGIDRSPKKYANNFPVYAHPFDLKGEVDLIIDFSHPSTLETLLAFAKEKSAALVIATTGFNDNQFLRMKEESQHIRILYSSNLSIGVNLFNQILKLFTRQFSKQYDIELIEKHHNRKLDAPSGTAYLLANTMNEALGNEKEFIYGRYGNRLRNPKQIGIHAVRGGTIAGEHTVLFAGEDETIEITHSALSRELFARGALQLGSELLEKPVGFYTMDDMLKVE